MDDPPSSLGSTLSGTPESPDDRFLYWLNSRFESIVRNIDEHVDPSEIQRHVGDLCQELTDSRTKHGRLGVEPNRLLYPDWQRHWGDDEIFYSGLFDQWLRGKLDAQQFNYLQQTVRHLVRFAVEGKTDRIRHRFAQELRGVLGDYLSLRGILITPQPENPDAENGDGPVAPDAFRYEGKIYEGLTQKAWLLIRHLWGQRRKSAYFSDLAEPVWNDLTRKVTIGMVGGLRRTANTFFERNAIPYKVSASDQIRMATLRRLAEKF